MKVKRGEIVLASFPFADGSVSKKRPVLVVQADLYNRSIHNAIVAEITSNTGWAADPSHLLIDVSTPDGQATGLLRNSVVSCLNLATMNEVRIERRMGVLSSSLMEQVEACLRVALGLS